MPLITLHDSIRTTRSDLTFRTPGDRDLPGLYGKGGQVMGSNPGFFSGHLVLGGYIDPPVKAIQRQMELLLVRLRDPTNTFTAPLWRPAKIERLDSLTVAATSLYRGAVEIGVSGPPDGLIRGDIVIISGRRYALDSDMANGSFTATATATAHPAVLPRPGDRIVWQRSRRLSDLPTVASASLSDGEVAVSVRGGTSGLVAGDYVQISARLYILSSDMQNGSFNLLPSVLPRLGDPVRWRNVYAIAKVDREQDGIVSKHDPDFSGPWSIPWHEQTAEHAA